MTVPAAVGLGATGPDGTTLDVGQVVARSTYRIRPIDLVRYAGASGDFNPIHWSPRAAAQAELPGVIAHGMFTMATAVRVVVDWCGDPGAVLEYGVRFTRPLPVPDPDGAELVVVATIGALDREAGTARVDLTATSEGAGVLGKARAVVRLG